MIQKQNWWCFTCHKKDSFSGIINIQPKDWTNGSFQFFRTDNWQRYEVAHTCAEGCK